MIYETIFFPDLYKVIFGGIEVRTTKAVAVKTTEATCQDVLYFAQAKLAYY